MKRRGLKRGDFFYYPGSPSLKFMVPFDKPGYPNFGLPEGFNLSQPTPQDMESDVIQIDVLGRCISQAIIEQPSDAGSQEEVSGKLCAAGSSAVDNPTSPGHYRELNPEPIDVIESWGLNFRLANVLKYVARAGNKPGTAVVEDLRKARQYLNREIAAQEGRRAWE